MLFYLEGEKENIEGIIASPHKVNLTPGNVFSEPKFLSIFFPNQNKYLLRDHVAAVDHISHVHSGLSSSLSHSRFSTIIRQKKSIRDQETIFINNMDP